MSLIDTLWKQKLKHLLRYGDKVTPRGKRTLELRGDLIRVPMERSVITILERKLGYRFMCAEAAWVLSGDDRVETIAPYSKTVTNFSDDGVRFFGAYGPKFVAQVEYVVDTLARDASSRQAVFNIWRENPPLVKDFPCTLSGQFMLRRGRLDAYVTMRSSDAWLGVPYDVFTASAWAAYVAIALRNRTQRPVELGDLYNYAASRHLYETNWDAASTLLDCHEGFDYKELDLNEFAEPGELVNHLWTRARGERTPARWLEELPFKSNTEGIRQ